MPPKGKLSQPPVSAVESPAAHRPAARLLLADEAAFLAALDALADLDAAFVAAMRAAGDLPRLRRREPGFAGLAAIIVSQQVSTASANAIFGRLQARFPALAAADILGADDADLRACGLSAPKIRTLRAIAEAVDTTHLDFAALAAAEAEAAHATLCSIKGIGPWTADIFLLFCLGHADAWPAGDLALQEGARLVLGLDARPDTKALQALGERWRPLRGVAAHCLWAYYSLTRARPSTLEETAAPKTSSKARTPKPMLSTKRAKKIAPPCTRSAAAATRRAPAATRRKPRGA